MTKKRNFAALSRTACIALLAGFVLVICQASPVFAQNNPDPNGLPGQFDFADSFYINNGMDLSQLNLPGDARQCVNPPLPNGNAVLDLTNTSPTHNDCRVLQTLAVFNNVGQISFFNAMGVLANVNSFADCCTDPNSIGTQTHAIADSFRAFFAPIQKQANGTIATVPCTPTVTTNCVTLTAAEGSQRAERVFDTATTYFCADLLNLWRITYTIYTAQAFTKAGQKILAPFAKANGVNSDGTPILTKTADIDNLTALGLLQEIQPAEDGSQGIGWIVCVVLADPTMGAVTKDAFLVSVVFPGTTTPVSPQFQTQFNCLQATGQFCPATAVPPASEIPSGTPTIAPAYSSPRPTT
jgi:hypothetical protein